MRKIELTFDAVDDLVGAHSRGRLNPSRVDIACDKAVAKDKAAMRLLSGQWP